jgi:hypothetical protein
MNSSCRGFVLILLGSAALFVVACEEKKPLTSLKPEQEAPSPLLSPSPNIAEVKEEKKSPPTSTLNKLDSHIVLALEKSRGEPPFDKPTQLDPDLVIEADGRVLVDLNATVSKELLARIETDGGKVINSFEAARAIRALVPLSRMEALASRADIQFIALAAQATTNGGDARQGSSIKP